MEKKEKKLRFVNKTAVQILAVVLVLLVAVALLWHGNATSMQAQSAMIAQVYFDGEYRIADGQWQDIEPGKHIPSTKGDVTLRGNFHMLAPDGEYVGIYTGEAELCGTVCRCSQLRPKRPSVYAILWQSAVHLKLMMV